MPAFNGRSCRAYGAAEPSGERFFLFVHYHRRIGRRTRALTVSPKLLKRHLRTTASEEKSA